MGKELNKYSMMLSGSEFMMDGDIKLFFMIFVVMHDIYASVVFEYYVGRAENCLAVSYGLEACA